MSRIKYARATVTNMPTIDDRRILKYNGRYYTAFGRLFAMRGAHPCRAYAECCDMQQYGFSDWGELRGLYRLDGQPGRKG